ncbi:MAG: OmpA family protein [Pseudomonadota bacterium]
MKVATKLRISSALACALFLSGCVSVSATQKHPMESAVLNGPPVTDNRTPIDDALQCYAQRLRDAQSTTSAPLKLAVGNIKDYTGKFSELDGGNPITQGGSLMVISALGKLRGAVQLFERFDTQVAEMELGYMDQRRLGDGQVHVVNDAGTQQQVPWRPYYGGSIMETDYYIVGGITELNYNISSGGAEVRVNGIGPRVRTYTVNVAADLRIVDTKTLAVVDTTSLQKQIIGYEVGFEVFRFFSDNLVDINAGNKNQEPLQLGVRTTLEMGVMELLSTATGVSYRECLDFNRSLEGADAAQDLSTTTLANQQQNYEVRFAFDSAELTPEGEQVIENAAQNALSGVKSELLVEGHTDSSGDEVYNLYLSSARAQRVMEALVAQGVPRTRISLVWYGQSAPAIDRGDGVSEAANRRAIIHILAE